MLTLANQHVSLADRCVSLADQRVSLADCHVYLKDYCISLANHHFPLVWGFAPRPFLIIVFQQLLLRHLFWRCLSEKLPKLNTLKNNFSSCHSGEPVIDGYTSTKSSGGLSL